MHLAKWERDPRVPKRYYVHGRAAPAALTCSPCSTIVRGLLLLDAIDMGATPGTVLSLAGEELHGLMTGKTVHQLGVADLLRTLPLVSDIDREIVILGVQPASTDWGTELSPSVEAAMQPLLEKAVEQLLLWAEAPASANA